MGDLEGFKRYYLMILGRKASTTERQVERLRTWERVAQKPATEIESSDVLQYLEFNPLGHAGNTRKGMLTAIQAFHRWESATGQKTLNGICDICTPSINDEDSPPPLDPKHVRPLMGACVRPLEYRVIYGGLFLGLRIGESASLHGAMWVDDVVWIKGEKTDKKRAVPIHRELQPLMWTLLAHPPTDPSTMQRIKRRLEDRTGIRFVAHQLRKRFAQSLADAGVDKGTRADLLGHRTVEDIYASPSLATLRDAVGRLAY